MTDDDIRRALSDSHPDDLPAIRKYVAWVQFKRMIHNAFYFRAHWIRSNKQAPMAAEYHWVR